MYSDIYKRQEKNGQNRRFFVDFLQKSYKNSLSRWGRGRCIHFFDFFDFLFKLILAQIIHSANFVYLRQSQSSLAQFSNFWLRIVLTQVLVCFRTTLIEFFKNHNFIYCILPAAGLTGAAAPPAGIVPGAPPGAAPASMPGSDIISPV